MRRQRYDVGADLRAADPEIGRRKDRLITARRRRSTGRSRRACIRQVTTYDYFLIPSSQVTIEHGQRDAHGDYGRPHLSAMAP